MEIYDTIYLQVHEFPETTWCCDRINDDDIEYVLATRVDELEAASRNLYRSLLVHLPPKKLPADIAFYMDELAAALENEAHQELT